MRIKNYNKFFNKTIKVCKYCKAENTNGLTYCSLDCKISGMQLTIQRRRIEREHKKDSRTEAQKKLSSMYRQAIREFEEENPEQVRALKQMNKFGVAIID